MLRPVAARLVAAVVLTAAASLALPAAPASAAACPAADGVTVVVDFHELGGGLQQVCDADGADRAASELFPESGFPLTYVQRQPGFVCRVSGAPAEDPCQNTPPADAYWGLWWSDGTSGSWKYSTEGVGSLSVPDGGSVALSWNGSSTKAPPGAAPPANAAEPSPSPSPQPSPSSPPSGGGGSHSPTAPATSGGTSPSTGGASASAADPSAGPSTATSDQHEKGARKSARKAVRKDARKAEDKKHDKASARAKPSKSAATPGSSGPAPAALSDPPDSSGGGLPVWVAPLGIAVLFAAAAGTAVVRRRRGNPGP